MDTCILGTLGKDFWSLSTFVWWGQNRWHCQTSSLWLYLGSLGASPSPSSWQISSRVSMRLTETIHLVWYEHNPLSSVPLTWMVWKPCRHQPLYWKSLLQPQKANLLQFSQGGLRSWKFQGEGDRRKIHTLWEETDRKDSSYKYWGSLLNYFFSTILFPLIPPLPRAMSWIPQAQVIMPNIRNSYRPTIGAFFFFLYCPFSFRLIFGGEGYR